MPRAVLAWGPAQAHTLGPKMGLAQAAAMADRGLLKRPLCKRNARIHSMCSGGMDHVAARRHCKAEVDQTVVIRSYL